MERVRKSHANRCFKTIRFFLVILVDALHAQLSKKRRNQSVTIVQRALLKNPLRTVLDNLRFRIILHFEYFWRFQNFWSAITYNGIYAEFRPIIHISGHLQYIFCVSVPAGLLQICGFGVAFLLLVGFLNQCV